MTASALRTTSQADPKALEELFEQGYTVFEAAYSDDEVEHLRELLLGAWRDLGSPALRSNPPAQLADDIEVGPAGIIFHKLTRRFPDVAGRLYKPVIMDTLRALMGEDMYLELPAGVLSDATRPFFDWHLHIDGVDDAYYDNKRQYPTFTRSHRVTHLLYLEDMTEDMGRLLVYPRKLTDPTDPPFETTRPEWPDQVEIACPKGSVVVLEQCTWHAARQKTSPGIRSFVGSYFAAGHVAPTPLADPELAEWEGDDPVFRSVIPRKRAS